MAQKSKSSFLKGNTRAILLMFAVILVGILITAINGHCQSAARTGKTVKIEVTSPGLDSYVIRFKSNKLRNLYANTMSSDRNMEKDWLSKKVIVHSSGKTFSLFKSVAVSSELNTITVSVTSSIAMEECKVVESMPRLLATHIAKPGDTIKVVGRYQPCENKVVYLVPAKNNKVEKQEQKDKTPSQSLPPHIKLPFPPYFVPILEGIRHGQIPWDAITMARDPQTRAPFLNIFHKNLTKFS
jgi:hypothetical protein